MIYCICKNLLYPDFRRESCTKHSDLTVKEIANPVAMRFTCVFVQN
jgi:hypothetical protein